ncbi:integumentary mucin A.1 [Drosophila bipectinata]|uniref:integumentary mucin A.1 n=1 Tax=Drosophila bipectinata TaxID=42026 RepID=UPI001C897AFB|nr:integumentary mucin C.1 [Drosophila bipectinata]
MKPTFKTVIFLCFLVSGGLGQDVEPEFPVFVEDTTETETEKPIASTTVSTTSTTPEPPTTTTESTTTTTTTTETTTTSTTPEPTTTTTEATTTSTTPEPTTTPVPSTTTVGIPTTISTSTQREPTYPTQLPTTTTRKPPYTTRNPWDWYQPAQRCYLKDQVNYAINCYGYGWTISYSCYRCCYYDYNHISGCSKLHQGRCWWYNGGYY